MDEKVIPILIESLGINRRYRGHDIAVGAIRRLGNSEGVAAYSLHRNVYEPLARDSGCNTQQCLFRNSPCTPLRFQFVRKRFHIWEFFISFFPWSTDIFWFTKFLPAVIDYHEWSVFGTFCDTYNIVCVS